MNLQLWLHNAVLNHQLRALFDVFELRDIKVPAIAARVKKCPAVVGFSVYPQLNGVGDIEHDFRRVRSDLAEREGILVPRCFESVCGYS